MLAGSLEHVLKLLRITMPWESNDGQARLQALGRVWHPGGLVVLNGIVWSPLQGLAQLRQYRR